MHEVPACAEDVLHGDILEADVGFDSRACYWDRGVTCERLQKQQKIYLHIQNVRTQNHKPPYCSEQTCELHEAADKKSVAGQSSTLHDSERKCLDASCICSESDQAARTGTPSAATEKGLH